MIISPVTGTINDDPSVSPLFSEVSLLSTMFCDASVLSSTAFSLTHIVVYFVDAGFYDKNRNYRHKAKA